jgi:rhodanese-related sulfurtransferase
MNPYPVGLAALVAIVLLQRLSARRGDVTGPEARELVEQGARLLDVRTAGEFAGNGLPGAINIPLRQLEQRAGELGSKVRPIIVYCQSGHRSQRACAILAARGFSTVRDLGAMRYW